MAAVLDYGSKPIQPAAMYPFFTADSSGYNTADMRPHQTPTTNLDGAYDRLKDNPFTKSKIGPLNYSRGLHTTVEPSKTQIPQIPQIPYPNEQVSKGTSSAEIDPNLTRRKRRKLTPTEHVENVTQLGSETREITTAIELPDKPVSADKDSDHPEPLRNVDPQQSPKGDHSISPQHISKTPKRGRPRKDVVGSQNVASHIPEQGATEELKLTPPKAKRSTPTKKSLSLHANGRLLSSPTRRSPQSKKLKIGNNEKATSNRNFRMKNGKFVQSLEIVLKYGHSEATRGQLGDRIDAILTESKSTTFQSNAKDNATTHPFFLGKVKPKQQDDEQKSTMGNTTECESESGSRHKETVAWKDIKFSSQKLFISKSSESPRAIWPPLPLQHIGRGRTEQDQATKTQKGSNNLKLKTQLVQVPEAENILLQFVRDLEEYNSTSHCVQKPERIYSSGAEMALKLSSACHQTSQHDAIITMSSALKLGTSAFDRGECAGPNIWPLQYAPTRWSEVLQPSAHVLHQWLQDLAVHNVKSGIDMKDSGKKLKSAPKKKRRKLKDELDDFIVNSDDDLVSKATKNAILITGPYGCGKTASVYAVAKELGFEVFEIHPGMRRSAKDIFDKVGDMAHNHLVQRGPEVSRNSSEAPSESDAMVDTDTESKQPAVADFLKLKNAKVLGSINKAATVRANKVKREQKQSLILFEEVDLLFDEDKGFWSGVLSLISNSKRPVVMTCNDMTSIPVDDLDLYDTLEYQPIDSELAADYLLYLAAAEGHIIDRKALLNLYTSRGNDLRASITELNLWCQMTVGSNQGGLDWITHSVSDKISTEDSGKRLRLFSKDTFHESLHLLPQVTIDDEAAIKFNQESLGIAPSDWCDFQTAVGDEGFRGCHTNLQALSRISDIDEARSALDLFDDEASPALALAAATLCSTRRSASDRHEVASRYLQRPNNNFLRRKNILQALDPIMVEKPTFPPSQGRLAPSLDACTSSIATEIAPYIRNIVRFDTRLEQHRDQVFGSQGKARKTRAARAAAEGGDKASTRSERWFPKSLDFEMVLATAGDWPEWYEEQLKTLHEVEMASPSTSSDI